MSTTLRFDMIQTVALAAVVLFAGYGIRRRVGLLDRFNIPAPVIGGFVGSAGTCSGTRTPVTRCASARTA